MNKIKFVYFDIGGVLLNWKNIRQELFRLCRTDWEGFIKNFIKFDELAIRGQIQASELGQKFNQTYNIGWDADFDYLKFWTDGFFPYPESHKLLQDIVIKYPIGYLTNIYFGTFEKQLAKKDIPSVKYSQLIQSCDIGFVKPEKEIFQYSAQKCGFSPSEILFIDDTKINIQAASQFGFNTFLFNEDFLDDSILGIKEILQI